MNKKSKRIFIELLIILLFVIIFVGRLFPVNYPTDIYQIRDLGLKQYAISYFLPSGRFIGMLVLMLFEDMGFSVDLYITIMKVFAIVIATASIFLMYRTIINLKSEASKSVKALIFLATIVLFLNHSTYEFFYYPESGIMWLAILFVILALKQSLNKKYVLTWLSIFISLLCYQSVTFLFLPAFLFLYYTKTKDIKDTIKEFFKHLLFVAISLIIGYILIVVARSLDFVIIENSTDFVLDLKIIFDKSIDTLVVHCDNFPNIVMTIINIALILITLIIHNPKKNPGMISIVMLMFFISFAEVICTISFLDYYNCDRIQYAYSATTFLSILFLICNTSFEKYKKLPIILSILAFIIILVCIGNSHQITKYSFIARDTSNYIMDTIKRMVVNYEATSNKKIYLIKYCEDHLSFRCDQNVHRVTWEPTTRAITRMEF